MDAEKLLQAFTPQETGELVAALPAELLQAELARRGLEMAPAIGTAAIEAPKSRFEQQLATYLDPEATMELDDQLEVVTEFWGKLGHELPQLSNDQRSKLAETAAAHPNRRVVPTPLLDLDGRKAVAEAAKTAFPNNTFANGVDALWTPSEDYMYGKLLRNPNSTVTVKEGRKRKQYGLRYNTSDGVLTRSEFVSKQKEAGRAVEASDGTAWMFPVMDVQVASPRTYARADELHKTANITQVPESLIAMQTLHQANGTPNPDWSVDFTNEAVYELDEEGLAAVAPVYVAGVRWDPSDRQVRLNVWDADGRYGYFGVRGAESGI